LPGVLYRLNTNKEAPLKHLLPNPHVRIDVLENGFGGYSPSSIALMAVPDAKSELAITFKDTPSYWNDTEEGYTPLDLRKPPF
jgi:hypothetical protein